MISTVSDRSQIAESRRLAVDLAQASGFDEPKAGRVALSVTEMATNLLKHAGGGKIHMHRIADRDGDCLELLSLDSGPGIGDIGRAMEDGFSSAGSPGTGLGALKRQADRFALWSRPGLGTVVMARFVNGPSAADAPALGVVTAPYPGETATGDGWAVRPAAAGPRLLLADGSGHGAAAAAAADLALGAFDRYQALDCVAAAEAIHRALKPTRGAAIALAEIDTGQKLVRFVGIGNIVGALISEGICRRMVSHNGIAGHVAPRVREFTYPYSGVPTLILHSDGLSAKWNLDTYAGLAASHPSLIAGMLFRTYRRERDDACVVVMRGSA